MGAWGHDTFHNDTAGDFTAELAAAEDLDIVEEKLDEVISVDDEEELESDLASEALAACEVVARLQGRWGVRDAYSKSVDDWVLANPQVPGKHVLINALEAIDRICGKSSELAELWAGQDQWRTAVADLRARVAG